MAIPSVTVGDLYASVSYHLTNAATVDTTFKAEILKALGWVLTDMTRQSYMPAFRTEAQLSLVSGTSDYDMPDDFEAIIEDTVYFDASPRRTLQYYEEQDRIRGGWQESLSSNNEPRFYTIRDRDVADGLFQIRFLPTPDASYTVNYTYFAQPTHIDDSSDDADNLDYRFPRNLVDGLVKGACLSFPQYLSSDQQAAFRQQYLEAKRSLRRKQDPVVGHPRVLRPFPHRYPNASYRSQWHKSIYTGSPGDYQ